MAPQSVCRQTDEELLRDELLLADELTPHCLISQPQRRSGRRSHAGPAIDPSGHCQLGVMGAGPQSATEHGPLASDDDDREDQLLQEYDDEYPLPTPGYFARERIVMRTASARLMRSDGRKVPVALPFASVSPVMMLSRASAEICSAYGSRAISVSAEEMDDGETLKASARMDATSERSAGRSRLMYPFCVKKK